MSAEPEEEGEVVLPESESVPANRPEPSFRGRGGGFVRGGRGGFSRGRGGPFRGGRGGGFDRGAGFSRPARSSERQQSHGPAGSQINRPPPRPEGFGGNGEGEPPGRGSRSLSPRGRRPVPPPSAGPPIAARQRAGRSVSPPPPAQTHDDAPPNRNRPQHSRTRSPPNRGARPSPPDSSTGQSYSGAPRNRSPPPPPPSSQPGGNVKPRQARSRSPSTRGGPLGPPPSTFERGGRGRGAFFGSRGGRGGRPIGRDRSADRFEDRFPPPPTRHDDLARSGGPPANRSDDHTLSRGPAPSIGGDVGPRRDDRGPPPGRRFEGAGGRFEEERRPRFPPMEQGRPSRGDDFDGGRPFVGERRPSYEPSPPSRQVFNQQDDGRAPQSPPPSQRPPRERSRPGRPSFPADVRPYPSDARPSGGPVPPRRAPERSPVPFDDRSDAVGNRDDRTRGPPRGEERGLELPKRGRFPVEEGEKDFSSHRGGPPPPSGEFRDDNRGMARGLGRDLPSYARDEDRSVGRGPAGIRQGPLPSAPHRPGGPAASPSHGRRARSPPPPPPPMSGPALPSRRRSPPSAPQGPPLRGQRSPSPAAPPQSSARFPPSGQFPPPHSAANRVRGRSGSPPPAQMPSASSYSADDRMRRPPARPWGMDAGTSFRRARSRSPPPTQGPARFIGRGPGGPGGRGMFTARTRGPSSGRPRNLQTNELSDEEEEGVVKIETPQTSSRFGASEVAKNLDGVPPLSVLNDRLIASAATEALKQAEKLRQDLDALRLGQFQSSLSLVQVEMRRKWAEFELRQADEALSEIQASRSRHSSLF